MLLQEWAVRNAWLRNICSRAVVPILQPYSGAIFPFPVVWTKVVERMFEGELGIQDATHMCVKKS